MARLISSGFVLLLPDRMVGHPPSTNPTGLRSSGLVQRRDKEMNFSRRFISTAIPNYDPCYQLL